MSANSEQKLVTMAENYYLDLRGSFDESIDKVAGSVAPPTTTSMGVFVKRDQQISSNTTTILELVFELLL